MAKVNEAFKMEDMGDDSESNDELENRRNSDIFNRRIEEARNNGLRRYSAPIDNRRSNFGPRLDAVFDTRKLTQMSPTPIQKKPPVPVVAVPPIPSVEEIELGLPTAIERSRRRSKFLRIFTSFTLCFLYILYIIAVIIIHSKIEDKNYWCDGDGFLFSMTLFVLCVIAYCKGIKPLLGKKNCFRPLLRKLRPYKKNWYLNYVGFIVFYGLILAFLILDSSGERERLISIAGIFVLLLFGYVFSKARNKVNWHHVVWGLGLQYILGYIVLNWGMGKMIFQCLAGKVQTYLEFTDAGSGFVFGKLSTEMGIFAFKVLSVILFFSFCIQILYYYGAMQWLVIKIGWMLQVTIGTTACESINAAANIFLGQTEAPLMVKPFIHLMTKSELHAIMTGGFATIAGSVMAAYISFGIDAVTLLSASVMNAPAALAFSKLFYPEIEISNTKSEDIKIEKGKEANVLHAAIEGVTNAIPLVANIGANLIAVTAFIAFLNAILNWSCQLVNIDDGVCSLSNIFGYLLIPLTYVMGVPWADCQKVSQLIGTKVMINEFVAYVQLAGYKKQSLISKRAEVIATFSLCGFSNLSSIGIILGGLGAMAPQKRGEMSQIVVRAMIAGNVASLLSACIAGTLVSSADDPFTAVNSTSMFLNITS